MSSRADDKAAGPNSAPAKPAAKAAAKKPAQPVVQPEEVLHPPVRGVAPGRPAPADRRGERREGSAA